MLGIYKSVCWQHSAGATPASIGACRCVQDRNLRISPRIITKWACFLVTAAHLTQVGRECESVRVSVRVCGVGLGTWSWRRCSSPHRRTDPEPAFWESSDTITFDDMFLSLLLHLPTCSHLNSFHPLSHNTLSIKMVKATVIGAAGGIGQPLSLLLKQSSLVTDLALYDV